MRSFGGDDDVLHHLYCQHVGGGRAAVAMVVDAIAADSESDFVRVSLFGAIVYLYAAMLSSIQLR